jgi:hypothetical protein
MEQFSPTEGPWTDSASRQSASKHCGEILYARPITLLLLILLLFVSFASTLTMPYLSSPVAVCLVSLISSTV